MREVSTPDLVVLAYGVTVMTALDAAASVAPDLAVEVWDARFAKPVDGSLIERTLSAGTPILTVEEHTMIGGFGTAVIEEAVSRHLDASLIERVGLPDGWIHQGSRPEQLADAGLDQDGLISAMRRAARRSASTPPVVEVGGEAAAIS